ncbi:hypothetical protein NHX12_015173 [Muraenolepis orangiensis]|uniref:G protein-coupled receptor 137 n=1 Tax=Muraenolepis orangiensis TaxID=630683 RepID=A0A9Q0D9X9_9TELE|nr:hypothetical protein NHX12_015173 [Muraenolepis orangiensis]
MFSPAEEKEEVNAKLFPAAPEAGGEESPGLSPTLELGLTAVHTALYAAVFAFVYVQLWLVLRHGHERLSSRSALLFLCLLWAALRATLFSFYFQDAARANRLRPLVRWLLYCCPVCLQFFTLCLLNLYFAQYSPELTKYNAGGVRRAVLARVLVNDSLFVLCAVSLSVCIFRIANMSAANVYLESKGTSVRQAMAIGVLVVLLFTSRACYNLVVVALAPEGPSTPFSYGWYSVSDQPLGGILQGPAAQPQPGRRRDEPQPQLLVAGVLLRQPPAL